MRIVLPGGSGQVGAVLARAFHEDGHEVTVLSRSPSPSPWRSVQWNGETLGSWADALDGADAVINLAGHTVNCRYTARNRSRILESRVRSVGAIETAIRRAARPPRVWLQASTATIYSHRFDAANDDLTGEIGGQEDSTPTRWKFSIDVATAWERVLDEAEVPRTRRVKLRSAMIMSPDPGGIFDVLSGLARRGIGGRAGSGDQFVSWIHHVDFVRAVYRIIEREGLDGCINVASPNPIPNTDFMRVLRAAHGARFGLPLPKWLLEIGATTVMRTETELILKSRRVVPARLLDDGFRFRFPTWSEALADLSGASA